MDNENMNGDTFTHAFSQFVDAVADVHSSMLAILNTQFFASFGEGLSSGIVREAQKHKQARHIAHAAYGLTRKGSQGWRRYH